VSEQRLLQNRELQMMRLLDHPNVITLHYFFYSTRKGYKVMNSSCYLSRLAVMVAIAVVVVVVAAAAASKATTPAL